MRFDVCTLFPGLFRGFVAESLMAKAIERGLIDLRLHDFRDWTLDKHKKVDDRPYGGGPGMVLMVEPIVRCVESLLAAAADEGRTAGPVVLLTPRGRRLDQNLVEELVAQPGLILLCGRYEGFDQRVVDLLQPLELSLGDFVLNGGEVAAMALIECVSRLVPGVLGDERSAIEDSFSSGNRGLESPQYTRPRVFRDLAVPEVLFGGNHAEVDRWRRSQSEALTRQRRSDLLDRLADTESNSRTDAERPSRTKPNDQGSETPLERTRIPEFTEKDPEP